MHKQRHISAVVVILSLLCAILWLLLTRPALAATIPQNPGQPATPQPALTTADAALAQDSAEPVAADPGAGLYTCPTSPADAFGDPAFWMVMGLVVLGYLVLGAEFRQNPG
jgi:hypothetical protein